MDRIPEVKTKDDNRTIDEEMLVRPAIDNT